MPVDYIIGKLVAIYKLQAVFSKLENFYTKHLYGINKNEVPALWREENIGNTLWDYSYIRDIISCLEVCKNINSEVKYYCRVDF